VRALILARHGESEYSARGLVNGDATVDVGLTEAGEEQARTLGRLLAGEPIELCVTSGLPRTRRTAELALAGRSIPFAAWPELDDPGAGDFEGRHLDEYRAWAWSAGSAVDAPGGGESRLTVVGRYVRGYRALLDRPEATVLAVLHALPIAYLLGALEGVAPAARIDRQVEYARPNRVDADALRRALGVLESWCAAPAW
jgi:probable phosphoglycerate mutase